ncbi:MAG: hypothetical protein HY074_04630 [Deltaproteobacteria bacterium]|nr:hypothetical protein [Deltaproteobacteria bacterium]
MPQPNPLASLEELRNLILLLFCAAQIWAILAWPGNEITKKYPLSTRALLCWPFGHAWLEYIKQNDVEHFENYQRRARIACYLLVVAFVLSLV